MQISFDVKRNCCKLFITLSHNDMDEWTLHSQNANWYREKERKCVCVWAERKRNHLLCDAVKWHHQHCGWWFKSILEMVFPLHSLWLLMSCAIFCQCGSHSFSCIFFIQHFFDNQNNWFDNSILWRKIYNFRIRWCQIIN